VDAVLQARRESLREREGRGDREEIAVEAFLGGSEEYAEESGAAIREGKRRKRERGEGD